LVWKIEYSDSALKELRKLDKSVAKKILDYMEKNVAPKEDPTSVGKALSGTLATFHRYRVGDFRAICHIEEELITVLVLRVAHRSDVYDGEKKFVAKASSEIDEFHERKKEEEVEEEVV